MSYEYTSDVGYFEWQLTESGEEGAVAGGERVGSSDVTAATWMQALAC